MNAAMQLLAVTLVTTAAVAQQPPAPNPLTQRALQRLQGTWQFDAMEQDGKKVPSEELKGRTLFVGGDLFLIREGDKVLAGGKLSLEPSRSPATFNVASTQGLQTEILLQGIYEIQGDTLKLAFVGRNEDRPTEFASAAGSKVRMAVCQRLRLKDETIDIVGTYASSAAGADGKDNKYEAQVERRGDAYVMTFRNGPVVIYIGVAVRKGDTLSLAWGRQGQIGVSLYKIEKGPRLVGQYTTLGGPGIVLPELLTRIPNTD